MKVLLTGATGFIGKRLCHKLADSGHEIYVLVRRKSLEKAQALFSQISNVHLILGDISNNDVLDTMGGVNNLPDDIESVVHLAAIYDLEVGLSDAYANNVVGTQNIIYLIQRMKNVKYYHHVSTYAVSGQFDGEFQEEQIVSNIQFPDFYSRTKMQAEYLVRHALLKETKIRIYRPGIVVGDSKTGQMDKVDGPYYFLRLFDQLTKYQDKIPFKLLPLCCHASATLPLIPVDVLTDWLTEMICTPTQEKMKSYHLVPEEKIYITDFVAKAMKEFNLNLQITRVPFPAAYAAIMPLLKIPKELVPYMQSRTQYSTKQLKNDYPHLKSPGLKDYLPQMIARAKEMFQ
jgi:dTDP-4-dehydrorhamnose reductase